MDRETLKLELGFEIHETPTDTEILQELLNRLEYEVLFDLESGGRGHYTYRKESSTVNDLTPGLKEFNMIAKEAASYLRDWNRVDIDVNLRFCSGESHSHRNNIQEAADVFNKELRELEIKTRELADWRREIKALEERQDELKESVYKSRWDELMSRKP
jgi:hypothetical protein